MHYSLGSRKHFRHPTHISMVIFSYKIGKRVSVEPKRHSVGTVSQVSVWSIGHRDGVPLAAQSLKEH